MPAVVKIVVDGAAMQELLSGPEGPVMEFLIRRSTAFQAAARADAPVRSGCLRDSMVKRVETSEIGPLIRVVSDTRPCSERREAYSLFVHEGTRPHDIPNAFGWGPSFGIGGRFGGKFHPGNRANPFLAKNLPIFGTDE